VQHGFVVAGIYFEHDTVAVSPVRFTFVGV
jgi:hypothetical protein